LVFPELACRVELGEDYVSNVIRCNSPSLPQCSDTLLKHHITQSI